VNYRVHVVPCWTLCSRVQHYHLSLQWMSLMAFKLSNCSIYILHVVPSTGFPVPIFYWHKTEIHEFSRTPMNNFPGPFRSPPMLKYNKKHHLQSIVNCRNWQNSSTLFKTTVNTNWVIYHCCLFSIWVYEKMHDFQGYFSRIFLDLQL